MTPSSAIKTLGIETSADERRSITPLIAGLLAFVVYWWTLAPDLTWSNAGGDGGELITAAVTLGIPHPPGYPTYVLIGKLVNLVPLRSLAYRFNLFSAVSVATAVGFVTATVRRCLATPASSQTATKEVAALSTGLTLAFAPLVWSQATITEVYGLNLALLAAWLWVCLTKRHVGLAGLLLGLAVTTHLTSLFMLPLAGWRLTRASWLKFATCFGIGLTPFLLLPILAQGDSPVVWGQPTTLQGWWWLVSGRIYMPNAFALPATAVYPRLYEWGQALFDQFTWLGLPLLGLGAWKWSSLMAPQTSNRRQYYPFLLAGTAVLYLGYAFGYQTSDAIVLILPSLLLLSLLLAPGLFKLGKLALLLPLLSLLLNFDMQNLRAEDGIRPLAAELLRTSPPQALLLTEGDPTIFTLWYFHHGEGMRPDVIIVDSHLFAFDWYRQRLGRQYPALQALAQDDLDAFQQANAAVRPFCRVHLDPFLNTCLEDRH